MYLRSALAFFAPFLVLASFLNPRHLEAQQKLTSEGSITAYTDTIFVTEARQKEERLIGPYRQPEWTMRRRRTRGAAVASGTEVFFDPSIQLRPHEKAILDIEPLFGTTEFSKKPKMFIVFGWDF